MKFSTLLELIILPQVQFGIFGISLGGSKGTSSGERIGKKTSLIEENQTQRTSKNATTRTDKNTRGSQSSTTAGQRSAITTQEQLGLQSRKALQSMLGSLSDQSNVAPLIDALSSRAQRADAAMSGFIDPIVAKAQREGDQAVGQTMQRLSTGAGSSMNTLVQQLGLDEQRKVTQDVAALEATLKMQGRKDATSELQGASQLQIGGTASIANALKGSVITGTSAEETTQLAEALSQLSEQGYSREVSDLLQQLKGTQKTVTDIKESNAGRSGSQSAGFGFSI